MPPYDRVKNEIFYKNEVVQLKLKQKVRFFLVFSFEENTE